MTETLPAKKRDVEWVYVDWSPHTPLHQKQRTHKYMICYHNTHNGIFIILTRDCS